MTHFEKTYTLIKKVFAVRVAELKSADMLESAIEKTISDLYFLPEAVITATINQIGNEYK